MADNKETAWDKVQREDIAPDAPPRDPLPIVQDWVARLGMRLQGVLVSAIRGCDTVQRHDHSKVLARIYRSEILRTHGADPKKSKSFILVADIPTTVDHMTKFLNDCDHLPQHYVMHFLHAGEVLGYTHPDPERRDMWASFYKVACNKYHLRPEPYSEMIDRLEKDEENFHKAQDSTVTPRLFNENKAKREAIEKEAERKAREEREEKARLERLRYGHHGGS